jgi:hypothetical protein
VRKLRCMNFLRHWRLSACLARCARGVERAGPMGAGRAHERLFLWSGPDLRRLLRQSWFGRSIRNRRNESLGGDRQGMLLDLSPGNITGLRDNSGIKLDFELVILLLKSCGIVAIVSMLERNRLHF